MTSPQVGGGHRRAGAVARRHHRVPRPAAGHGRDAPVITLQEGGTPLLPAPVLSARTGCDVYLKVEGLNPTGSFKDRGMTVAITVAAGPGREGGDLRLDGQHLRARPPPTRRGPA